MIRNKIFIGLIVAGIATGLLMLLLGVNGPTYRTEVVHIPVNLQSPSEHHAKFTVDRSEEYMIEVHLKSVFSDEKMNKILGDFVKGGNGEIELSWLVKSNGSVIAQGSNAEYDYSPILGSGLVIGTISAEKGKEYLLSVFTNNVSSDWNTATPYVEVGLHPSKLEEYIVLQIFGLLIAAIFVIILIIVLILHIISKRNTASNKKLKQT